MCPPASSWHRPTPCPAQDGIIGRLPDGSIQGVDIVVPKFEFSRTIIFNNITQGSLKNFRYIVGKVNLKTFMGFPPRELLLLGVSGQYKAGATLNGVGSWTCTFKFGAQASDYNRTVGTAPYPVIGPFNRIGWQYIWFYYQDMLDPGGSGKTIRCAIAANIEDVYIATDFAKLGFGP